MMDFLTTFFQVFFSAAFLAGLLGATLRIATPLIYGTVGELFNERAGVVNLGIEGIMTLGALSAFIITYWTGHVWMGLVGAIVSGMLLSLFLAFLTVTLGLSQHVSGIGITFFGMGLSNFVYRVVVGTPSVPPTIEALRTVPIPVLVKLPFFGPVCFNQHSLTYLAFVTIPIIALLLYKTNFGLKIRTCGENPAAADTLGVNVSLVRYTSLIIGGAFIGLGGAFLSVAHQGMYIFGIVAGRGWICIALIVFANWKPGKILIGALLFAFIDALQLRLPLLGLEHVPNQLFHMLPYLFTIVMLILVARKASYPAALLKPYSREEG
jgi:simple sugar transport system permease protein